MIIKTVYRLKSGKYDPQTLILKNLHAGRLCEPSPYLFNILNLINKNANYPVL